MNADAFFAAEEATRERKLGSIYACRMYSGPSEIAPRVCVYCGKTFYQSPTAKRRYRMCEPCRRDPAKRKYKQCCVCGTRSLRMFPAYSTTPYFCQDAACQRKRNTVWARKMKGKPTGGRP